MLKKISLIKNLNKLLLSVNTRIESFFNSLKILISSKKKSKVNLRKLDKKIVIGLGVGFVLILSYFLIPSFYDKNLIKDKLENEIFEKFNLDIKLEKPLRYSLFPKPHFYIKDVLIKYEDGDLARADLTKIYITKNNFFSSRNLKIKNLFFKQTEFTINSKNYEFFMEILDSNKSNDNINFRNSKLFYKDKNEDVIFLANIKNLSFLYNDEFNQQLDANLEIFNIPLKINVINNLVKKNSLVDVNSRSLRMNIFNELDYGKENINGLIDFKVISKSKKINYSIDKNSLNFNSVENNFKGKLDFKPFYLSSDLIFHQLDIAKIFKSNSIFLDLLNADILNNQSLNAVININFDKIKNINYLKDFVLKMFFEEGNIFIKDSTINWKNSILINLNEIQLISENNNIIFAGSINFDFKDINEFYKQYQIKRDYRKNIKKVRFDFVLSLNENEIQFDNLKIDGSSNKITDNFINKFNSKKLNIFNKIIFKNSIKEFFGNI